MTNKIKLTPAEWEVMNAIWDIGGECSVRDVIDHSYANGEKAYTTIQAFMNILEKKGILKRRKVGLVNFYSPTRSKDKVLKSEMSSLLGRAFGGSVTAFATSLMSLENVNMEEIKRIKQLLNKKERELKMKMLIWKKSNV
jgi:predicted transcriptional regulator